MLIAARAASLPRHLWLLAPGALLLAGVLGSAPCVVDVQSPSTAVRAAAALHPTPGEWLVATHAMPDPTFTDTEILMLGHNNEGAFGLVMNGERWTLERGVSVSRCGPVGADVVVAVHRPSVRLRSTRPINRAWAITPVDEVLQAIDNGTELDDLVLCVGYAGWGPAQLSGELGEGVWRVEQRPHPMIEPSMRRY
jgi:putative transcriptional regulator